MRNWHKFGAKLTKNLVRNRSQFWCEIDLNLVRNRSFYQTGFGAKLTSLLYWIWCEIYLFTLLNLVRNRPKFGAKSTFLPLWIWCEINLNLVTNRHTIWKLTEFLRGENGFWSRQRAQQFLFCPWVPGGTLKIRLRVMAESHQLVLSFSEILTAAKSDILGERCKI